MSHLLSGSRGSCHCSYHTVGGASILFRETIGKSPSATLSLIKVAYTERTMVNLSVAHSVKICTITQEIYILKYKEMMQV